MSRNDLAAFLAVFMRAADFVVRAVDEAHGWVVEWLPFCAANGFLHVIKEGGEVSGVAIAGPISAEKLLATRRPERIMPSDFEPDGDVLFGAFLFVDPKRRGAGAGLDRFDKLLGEASDKFRRCPRFAYVRRGRLRVGDMAPIRRAFAAPVPPARSAEPELQESAISTSCETPEEDFDGQQR